jgi:hypothetical protein
MYNRNQSNLKDPRTDTRRSSQMKKSGVVKDHARNIAQRPTGGTKPCILLHSMAARKLGPSHSPYGPPKLTKEEQRLCDLYIPPLDLNDATGKKLAEKELKRFAAKQNNMIPSSSSEEEEETNLVHNKDPQTKPPNNDLNKPDHHGADVDAAEKIDHKNDEAPNNADRNLNKDADSNQKEVTHEEDAEDNKAVNGSQEDKNGDDKNNSAEDDDDSNQNDDDAAASEDDSQKMDKEEVENGSDDDKSSNGDDLVETTMSVESTEDEIYEGDDAPGEKDSASKGNESCDEDEEENAVGTGEDIAEPMSKKKKKRKRKRKRKREPSESEVEISTEEIVEQLFPAESGDEEVEEEKAETRTEDMLATLIPARLDGEEQDDSPEAPQVIEIPKSHMRNFRYAQNEDLVDLEEIGEFPKIVAPNKDKRWLNTMIGKESGLAVYTSAHSRRVHINFLNANKQPMYSHFPKLPDLVLSKRAHYTHYNHYFKVNQHHVKDNTIIAIVGKRAVRAVDIKTLAPGEWIMTT